MSRRGGKAARSTAEGFTASSCWRRRCRQHRPDELLAIDEALAKLTADDPQAAELVKLRYFAGLSVEESAKTLEMSRRNRLSPLDLCPSVDSLRDSRRRQIRRILKILDSRETNLPKSRIYLMRRAEARTLSWPTKRTRQRKSSFKRWKIAASEDRRAFLDNACGDEAGLRRRVEALIVAHERPESLLDNGVVAPPSQPTSSSPSGRADDWPLQAAGADRRRRLRRGLHGRADRAGPPQVALKIIKLGMDTKQVIARFEAERQALAMMDHPNIAKVLDAGATETGRPYFVMELVRASPSPSTATRTI